MTWARKRAVDVHDETAALFSAEYTGHDVYDSPFRYGRSLIDKEWWKAVNGLPSGANCLDIGAGVGVYITRLIERGFNVRGIEPSAEMRKIAYERLSMDTIYDASVTDLPLEDRSQDFIYAIEVFRYLDAADNAVGHREIFRALKPGGVFFGTYVNSWALDGYRQFVTLEKMRSALMKRTPRYHVEFETPRSLQTKLASAGFTDIEIRGAMFAPLRPLYKVSRGLATFLAKLVLPREELLSGGPVSRVLAGHLMATARKQR
jgi:ubiquinone/menaquinone biosynthesis C-methylase UbiE